MTKLVYQVVEHDGGWTYKVGDVFAETYRSHDAARAAAANAAEEHRLAGTTETIAFETPDGVWHEEVADGDDRPETAVEDKRDA